MTKKHTHDPIIDQEYTQSSENELVLEGHCLVKNCNKVFVVYGDWRKKP